ncbi:DUF6420 family protein [Streptomyces sp. NPDC006739]|uniref:DUF6420 family protein n=1 Tax=Streptomyces sp. NPDC006739 TaxID=3364763 RepID=UPI0036952E85
MTSEHRGAVGAYIAYDNLPVLDATEKDLPLLHPYGTVEVGGRYVTPGGGRLTVRKDGKHFHITLDHLGCPAQLTEEKTALFRRLGLAAEGHCVHAGCRHRVADAGAVLRSFQLRTGSIEVTAFVRAALAIELGDERPVDLLLKDAEALADPVRRADPQDEEEQDIDAD